MDALGASRPPGPPASAAARPTLTAWGVFVDPTLEARFWRDAHQILARTSDPVVMAMAAASFWVGGSQPTPRALMGPAADGVWAFGVALAVAVLAARTRPDFLAAHRVAIMPWLRVAILAVPAAAVVAGSRGGGPVSRGLVPPTEDAGAAAPRATAWLLFVLKSPRVQSLVLSGAGVVLPPAQHAAASAACALVLLLSLPGAAIMRDAYLGRSLHVRAASSLSTTFSALGLGGGRGLLPDRAALAVVALMQITALVASCILHVIIAASMRRSWRRRVPGARRPGARREGGQPTDDDGDCRPEWLESVDTAVLGVTAVAATAATVWWVAETAWGL